MSKLATVVLLSVGLMPILTWLEKYVFSDWEYMMFLIILMVLDTLLGVYKHAKLRTISSSAWSKVIDKMVSYFSLLIIVHVMSHFTIDGEEIVVLNWVKYLAYSSLIVKESISVIENVGAISPKFVPKNLLKKLKEFDKDGKFLK